MYIKINPIRTNNFVKKDSGKNQRGSVKSLQEVTGQDIAFKSALVLKKPCIKSPDIQKINDKIVSYVQKLPERAKLSRPMMIGFKDGVAGILVDKSKDNGTFVNIKIADSVDALSNWNSPEEPYMALEMTLNTAGQMINGTYYSMPERMTYAFTRSPKNVRRIEFANASYMPANEGANLWKKIIPHVVDYQYFAAAQKMEFNETELQEYFSELAKKDISILVK